MNTQKLPEPAIPATQKPSSLETSLDTYQPPAATVLDWLRANLGNRALAPLTGTDTKLLRAAVQIMEAYGYDRSPRLIEAFGIVVCRMQRKTQWLAFHAIAHPLDWSDRETVWRFAGLEPIGTSGPGNYTVVPKCSFEPGGSYRDLSEEGGVE